MRREALVNNSTKHNINGRIRAICIQHLGPPGYTHIYKFKPDRVFKGKRHNSKWTSRQAELEHNNREKKTDLGPKECVFDLHNGRIVVEFLPAHIHLFVAYATQKTFDENLDFINIWVKT